MYTGKVLATMNTIGLDYFHHITGSICCAECEDGYVLVGAYSGKILREIIAINRLSSFGAPPTVSPKYNINIEISQPTRLEIIGYNNVEMDEYGEV
jgi:hypothetical protein